MLSNQNKQNSGKTTTTTGGIPEISNVNTSKTEKLNLAGHNTLGTLQPKGQSQLPSHGGSAKAVNSKSISQGTNLLAAQNTATAGATQVQNANSQ